MDKFVIEREIPGAGLLTHEDLQAIAKKSCGVLREMGTGVQWLHSYVTENKIYCVYVADDAKLVAEHARRGGFPANVITRVSTVIDLTTAK